MEAIRQVREALAAHIIVHGSGLSAAAAGTSRTGRGLVGGTWLRRGLLSQRGSGLVLIDGQLVVRDANAAAAAAVGQPLQAGARLDSLLQART